MKIYLAFYSEFEGGFQILKYDRTSKILARRRARPRKVSELALVQ